MDKRGKGKSETLWRKKIFRNIKKEWSRDFYFFVSFVSDKKGNERFNGGCFFQANK